MKKQDNRIEMTEPGEIKIDPMLLNALVCPKTRTPLVYDHDKNELVSKKAKLAYPVRECVPIMLIEEARDIGNKTG